jgi:hypothetical protein
VNMEKSVFKLLATLETSRIAKAQMKRAEANRTLSAAIEEQNFAVKKYENEFRQFQSVQDLIVQAHRSGLDLIMHEAKMKRDHGQLKAISKVYSDALVMADTARQEIRYQAQQEIKSVEKKGDFEKLVKLDTLEKDAQIEEETQESLVMNKAK